ncbi:hypothetical protein IB277_29915 [Ensifer sp. ENS07]|uniref:hypothetical protein n=1 Tax=Ensifer sp. ENS07 TaxID=2769274 RepID=UPI001787399D|nr:hypothetical protein [Ensifer sp. ENS07]MBD9640517.1 hypothetical protein [Ensifer sp. ENS07]
MFLVRSDLDEAIKRWRDIIMTSLPWDRLGGYVALRNHDLTIELHDIDEDTDLLIFVTDGEALAERFRLAFPFVVTYGGNPGYPLEYLVWLSFHMQANFKRLGVLEVSATYEDEDGDIETMSAVAMGFSRQTDLEDFMTWFDGKDLSQDPLFGYEVYVAEVRSPSPSSLSDCSAVV